MTRDGNAERPANRRGRHMRRIARLALPTGAALGAGAAIAAAAAGQDATAPTTTGGATPVFQRAPSSYFLEIDGIKGESTSDKYAGAINVDYFSFGDEATGGGLLGAGGAGAGRVHFDDVTIKKDIDAASPQLFEDSVLGQHLSKVELIAVRDEDQSQQEYLKITLSNAIVSSYHVESQEPAGPGEVETITLEFQKIDYEYEPQNADGSSGTPIDAGWDVAANQRG